MIWEVLRRATDPAKRISGAVVGNWKKSVEPIEKGQDEEQLTAAILPETAEVNGYSNKMSLADLHEASRQ